MTADLPRLPELPAELLAAHAAAHAARRAALDAAPAHVASLLGRLEERLLVESLANVQPVRPSTGAQLLVPPPRAFLAPGDELRLDGARAALRHVRARVAVNRAGREPTMVAATPYVLHTCFEARMPSGEDHGAGLIRDQAIVLTARPLAAPLAAPGDCARLLDLAASARHDGPAIVRAAWLAFTVLTIHPFLDGNGRVARALFLAVQAEDEAVGIDGGVLEQLAHHHAAHLAALDEGWPGTSWDPAAVDASPFATLLVQASIIGAELAVERCRWIGAACAALDRHGISPDVAEVVVASAMWRVISPAELVGEDPGLGDALDAALDAGLVACVTLPASRRRAGDRIDGVQPTERSIALLGPAQQP